MEPNDEQLSWAKKYIAEKGYKISPIKENELYLIQDKDQKISFSYVGTCNFVTYNIAKQLESVMKILDEEKDG